MKISALTQACLLPAVRSQGADTTRHTARPANTLPQMYTFTAGASVQRREVLHGRVWMEHPVTVVSDDGEVLAVQLDPGSPFTFHDHPHGPHPWSSHTSWDASVVLQLLRTDTDYGVWKLFGTDGTFLHWYINFEAPIVRQPNAFDTDDHGLDLVVYPDGTRSWKDVEDLHRQRAEGRIDLATIGRVLAAAAEVTDLLNTGTEWWRPWADWQPALPS